MNYNLDLPLKFTEAAVNRVKSLINDQNNPKIKLRIYITGGGCGGFQYGFIFDDEIKDGDIIIDRKDIKLVIDHMSLQYLVGGVIDYIESLESSRFVVINPNAKSTCGCGSSFSI